MLLSKHVLSITSHAVVSTGQEHKRCAISIEAAVSNYGTTSPPALGQCLTTHFLGNAKSNRASLYFYFLSRSFGEEARATVRVRIQTAHTNLAIVEGTVSP